MAMINVSAFIFVSDVDTWVGTVMRCTFLVLAAAFFSAEWRLRRTIKTEAN
jgi:hypothetical protein